MTAKEFVQLLAHLQARLCRGRLWRAPSRAERKVEARGRHTLRPSGPSSTRLRALGSGARAPCSSGEAFNLAHFACRRRFGAESRALRRGPSTMMITAMLKVQQFNCRVYLSGKCAKEAAQGLLRLRCISLPSSILAQQIFKFTTTLFSLVTFATTLRRGSRASSINLKRAHRITLLLLLSPERGGLAVGVNRSWRDRRRCSPTTMELN